MKERTWKLSTLVVFASLLPGAVATVAYIRINEIGPVDGGLFIKAFEQDVLGIDEPFLFDKRVAQILANVRGAD